MKKIIVTVISSFILTALYLFVFGYVTDSHNWLILIMQFFTVVITLTCIFKGNKNIAIYNIIVFTILMVIAMVLAKNISKGGLYLLFLPLVYYLTKIYYRKRWLLLVLPIVILINSTVIFPNYFEFIVGFQAPKSIDVDLTKLNVVDRDGNNVRINNKGVIILDFWTTTCGICFKKFPKFDELNRQFGGSDNIKFYSVNVPVKDNEPFEKIVNTIEKYNYSFGNLFATKRKRTEELLDIYAYPKLIILQNGKVSYTKFKVMTNPLIFINNLEYKLNSLVQTVSN